jgi:hypothetical protein
MIACPGLVEGVERFGGLADEGQLHHSESSNLELPNQCRIEDAPMLETSVIDIAAQVPPVRVSFSLLPGLGFEVAQ